MLVRSVWIPCVLNGNDNDDIGVSSVAVWSNNASLQEWIPLLSVYALQTLSEVRDNEQMSDIDWHRLSTGRLILSNILVFIGDGLKARLLVAELLKWIYDAQVNAVERGVAESSLPLSIIRSTFSEDHPRSNIKQYFRSVRRFSIWESHETLVTRTLRLDSKFSLLRMSSRLMLSMYESITRLTWSGFRPSALWYSNPVYQHSPVSNLFSERDIIPWPAYTRYLDYGVQLGVIICKEARNVTSEEASNFIGGFVVFLEYVARDIQEEEEGTGTSAVKSMCFTGGVSPVIATVDSVMDYVNEMEAIVRINGNPVGTGITRGMRHSIQEMISYASCAETLMPGDLLCTGTIPGTSAMDTGRWLRFGDCVSAAIERVGELNQEIMESPEPLCDEWLPWSASKAHHRSAGPSISPEYYSLGPFQDLTQSKLLDLHTFRRAHDWLGGLARSPDSFAIDPKTHIMYTGFSTGAIVRFDPNNPKLSAEVVVHIGTGSRIVPSYCDVSSTVTEGIKCGRPLGMQFDDARQSLFICDAYFGLISIDVKAGVVPIILRLVSIVNDTPINFCHSLAISLDRLFFTDSSIFSLADISLDMLEGRPRGRIIEYDLNSQVSRIVADNLYFPTGLVVIDQNSLLVAEMTRFRIVRIPIMSKSPIDWSIFVDNLPGYVNHIRVSSHGTLWVAITTARMWILDALSNFPLLRSYIVKSYLYKFLPLLANTKSKLLEFNLSGVLARAFTDPSGSVSHVSDVFEYNGHLYIGSSQADMLHVIEKWSHSDSGGEQLHSDPTDNKIISTNANTDMADNEIMEKLKLDLKSAVSSSFNYKNLLESAEKNILLKIDELHKEKSVWLQEKLILETELSNLKVQMSRTALNKNDVTENQIKDHISSADVSSNTWSGDISDISDKGNDEKIIDSIPLLEDGHNDRNDNNPDSSLKSNNLSSLASVNLENDSVTSETFAVSNTAATVDGAASRVSAVRAALEKKMLSKNNIRRRQDNVLVSLEGHITESNESGDSILDTPIKLTSRTLSNSVNIENSLSVSSDHSAMHVEKSIKSNFDMSMGNKNLSNYNSLEQTNVFSPDNSEKLESSDNRSELMNTNIDSASRETIISPTDDENQSMISDRASRHGGDLVEDVATSNPSEYSHTEFVQTHATDENSPSGFESVLSIVSSFVERVEVVSDTKVKKALPVATYNENVVNVDVCDREQQTTGNYSNSSVTSTLPVLKHGEDQGAYANVSEESKGQSSNDDENSLQLESLGDRHGSVTSNGIYHTDDAVLKQHSVGSPLDESHDSSHQSEDIVHQQSNDSDHFEPNVSPHQESHGDSHQKLHDNQESNGQDLNTIVNEESNDQSLMDDESSLRVKLALKSLRNDRESEKLHVTQHADNDVVKHISDNIPSEENTARRVSRSADRHESHDISNQRDDISNHESNDRDYLNPNVSPYQKSHGDYHQKLHDSQESNDVNDQDLKTGVKEESNDQSCMDDESLLRLKLALKSLRDHREHAASNVIPPTDDDVLKQNSYNIPFEELLNTAVSRDADHQQSHDNSNQSEDIVHRESNDNLEPNDSPQPEPYDDSHQGLDTTPHHNSNDQLSSADVSALRLESLRDSRESATSNFIHQADADIQNSDDSPSEDSHNYSHSVSRDVNHQESHNNSHDSGSDKESSSNNHLEHDDNPPEQSYEDHRQGVYERDHPVSLEDMIRPR